VSGSSWRKQISIHRFAAILISATARNKSAANLARETGERFAGGMNYRRRETEIFVQTLV
jgi:hypothetical protein